MTVATGAHGLTTGDTVNITIAGATGGYTGYNGTYAGAVASSTTITYPLTTNPGGTATGSATLTQFVTGQYEIMFTSATAYNVTDPNTYAVGSGSFTASTSGTQSRFTSGKICFLLQQGSTAFQNGDIIYLTLSGVCGIFGAASTGSSANLIVNSSNMGTLGTTIAAWINGITSALTAQVTDTNYNEVLVQTVATGGATLTWTVIYSGYLTNIPITDKYFRGGCFQGDILAQVTGNSGSALTLNTTTIAQNGVNGGAALFFQGSIYTIGNLLYVTSVTSGTVQCGVYMFNAGLSGYTFIHRQVGGTTGGVGTYAMSFTQTIGSAGSPASTAVQQGFAQGSMGTDNYAALQNAVNLASVNTQTIPNSIPAGTTDYLQANVRTQRVTIRSYNGDGGAFGTLQPILLGDSMDVEWGVTGEVCALPGFMAQTGKYQMASLTWASGQFTVGLQSAMTASSGTVNVYVSNVSPNGYNGYFLGTISNTTTIVCQNPTAYTFTVSNITWASGTATVTISGFNIPYSAGTTGISVYISGVTPSGYNGTFTATISSSSVFTFPLASYPGAYSTGGTAAMSPGVESTLGQLYTLDPPLPNFGGRGAVMMTPLSTSGNYAGVYPYRGRLVNARISTYFGWAQRCLWLATFLYIELRGRAVFVFNRRGLLIGYKGNQTFNNTMYCDEIGGTTCYYILNKIDTEHRAVHIDIGSTDNIIDKLLIEHMYVPYEDNGSSNQLRESHCFPGDNLGNYYLGSQYTIGRHYSDSFGVQTLTPLGTDPPPAYCCVVGKSVTTGRIDNLTFAQNSLANAGTLNAAVCSIFYTGQPSIPVQVGKIYNLQSSFTMANMAVGPGASALQSYIEVLQPFSIASAAGTTYAYLGKFVGVTFNLQASLTACTGGNTLTPGAHAFFNGNGTRSLPAYPGLGQRVMCDVITTGLSSIIVNTTDGSTIAGGPGSTGVTLPTGYGRYEFIYITGNNWLYFTSAGY